MTDDATPHGDDSPTPPIPDGGADPTVVQPAQASFTSNQTPVVATGPNRVAWLLPFGIFAVLVLVVGLIALVATRDDASESPPVDLPPQTSVSEPTTSVSEPTTSVSEPTTSVPGSTTQPTVAEPCPDGYAEVANTPFGACSQGGIVAETQQLLNDARGAGLVVDGFYGPSSADVVRAAQADLGFTVDGIVTAELLDALRPAAPTTQAPTDPAGFVPAAPGTIRIDDNELPIVRTCTTSPGPGVSYIVTSYLLKDDRLGVRAVHHFSFRGGDEDATFDSVQSEEYQRLDQGFGFTFVEGDFLSTVTVNPLPDAPNECLGTAVESSDDGSTYEFSIIDICNSGPEILMETSEGGFVRISGGLGTEATAQLSFNSARSSVFTETVATSEGDGTTARFRVPAVRTSFDGPDRNVEFVIEFPAGTYPAC